MVDRVEANQVSDCKRKKPDPYRDVLHLNIFVAVVFVGSFAAAGWILS